MNFQLALGYPLVVVAVLEALLGVMLLRQNPRRNHLNRAVAAFSFFSAAFSLSTALMYIRSADGFDHIPFARLNWVGWFTIPAALQFVFWLRDENSRAARFVGWVLYPFWAAVSGLCLFTDLIVTDQYVLLPFQHRPGPLEYPVRFIGGVLILWLMVETVRLRKRVSGIKREQMNYFFHGILVFGTLGSLSAGFLQLFGGFGFEPGLTAYFSLPWVALTFYAIPRYRLFDIRIAVSNTLAALFLFALFAWAHVVIVQFLEPLAGSSFAILLSLSLMALVFFGTPFSRRVRDLIRRTVLQDTYLYQEVLRESSKAIITILDLGRLLDYIADTISSSLRVDSVSLYLLANDGRYRLRHGIGVSGGLRRDQTLDGRIVDLVRQADQIVVREEVERLLPEHTFGFLNWVLRDIGAELIIPLRYKDRLEGVLTVGQKGSGEAYLQSDIDLLDALAGHAAVAIENARLYDEAKRAHESLQESEARLSALAEHSIGKYLSQ